MFIRHSLLNCGVLQDMDEPISECSMDSFEAIEDIVYVCDADTGEWERIADLVE